MEETGNVKPPSIPENYVSILQLQKRWTEEQERKQKETEKSKETRQNLRSRTQPEDEQVRLRDASERKRREDKEGECVGTRKLKDSHVGRRNRTDFRWMPWKNEPENSGKKESVSVAIGCGEEETKDEGSLEVKGKKKKKKKKKQWRGNKGNQTRQEKGVVVDDAHASSTDMIRPNTEVRRHSIPKGEDCVENSGSAAADPVVEVERKLAGVSIYPRKDNRISISNTMPKRDYGRHNRVKSRDPRKPRDAGMVWVRKEEAKASSSIES